MSSKTSSGRPPARVPMMRGSARATAVALLVTVAGRAGAAPAEEAATCTLATCIEVALSRHPALAGMQARVTEARAAADLHRAEALPTVGVEGGTGYINGEAVTYFGALGGRQNADGTPAAPLQGALWDATFVVLLPLFREGRLIGDTPIAEREARLGIQEQEMSRETLRRQVATAVADAWFTALKLQKAEPLQASVVAAREAVLKGAEAQEQERLISHAAALSARVGLASARHQLESTRIARLRAERALGAATGQVGTAIVPVEEASTLDPAAGAAGLVGPAPSMASAPEIRAAEFRVQQKQEEMARMSRQGWPTATVRAHYAVADGFALPVNNQYYVGLRLSVPLFDSGQTGKRVAMAQAQKEQAESALAALRLARAAEMEDLTARIRQLEADIALRDAQIEQARETVRAASARAAERLSAPGEEEEAQVALLELELSRSAARHDRALAETRLRIASGEWESSGLRPGLSP